MPPPRLRVRHEVHGDVSIGPRCDEGHDVSGGEDPGMGHAIEWTRRFLSRAYAEGDIDDETYERLRARLGAYYARQHAETPVRAVAAPAMSASLPPFPSIPSVRPRPSFRPMLRRRSSSLDRHRPVVPAGSNACASRSPRTSRCTASPTWAWSWCSGERSASCSSRSARCLPDRDPWPSWPSRPCCSGRRRSCAAEDRPSSPRRSGWWAGPCCRSSSSLPTPIAFPPTSTARHSRSRSRSHRWRWPSHTRSRRPGGPTSPSGSSSLPCCGSRSGA